jgi:hypothetical protein
VKRRDAVMRCESHWVMSWSRGPRIGSVSGMTGTGPLRRGMTRVRGSRTGLLDPEYEANQFSFDKVVPWLRGQLTHDPLADGITRPPYNFQQPTL